MAIYLALRELALSGSALSGSALRRSVFRSSVLPTSTWPGRVVMGVALLIPLSLSGHADTVHRESRSQTTNVVTAADGTTTTTITEKVTRDGRTTTTTRTVVSGPGEPVAVAPPGVDSRPAIREPARPADSPPTNNRDSAALPREAVDAHNRERHKHGVGDLSWDPKLATFADKWAHHLCRAGRRPPPLQHRPPTDGGPGENLWEAVTTEATRYSISDAVKSWAGEQKYYNERSGQCQGGECGHYTQLVWRSTQQVGCGVATCPAGAFTATIWVCNYAPAGNFVGERPY